MNKRYNFLGLLRCFWTGYFFNQILPSNIGGDAFRGYCIYKNGESIKNSISSIVIDRLFGIIGLILLFILTILMLPDLTNIFELEFSVIFSIFIALFSIIILNNFLRDSSWKLARGLRHISHIMRSIIFKSLCGIRLIMLSFSVHVLSVVIVIALSEGLNLNIQWSSILIILPLVTLLMIMPVSIAGWGVRESGMVIGLGYFGVHSESALALSVLYGISTLLVTIPGLFLWLFKENNQ